MTQLASKKTLPADRAAPAAYLHRPRHHRERRYAWLKDARWQEVLRDPSILDPDIRKYLEAENDYTESLLGHTARFRRTGAEMRGRIKEDDFSVPSPDGPFAYLRNFARAGSTKCSAARRATAASANRARR